MKKRKEITITLSPETIDTLFRCVQTTFKNLPKDVLVDDLVYLYCLLGEHLPRKDHDERMSWLLKLKWLRMSNQYPPRKKRSVKK